MSDAEICSATAARLRELSEQLARPRSSPTRRPRSWPARPRSSPPRAAPCSTSGCASSRELARPIPMADHASSPRSALAERTIPTTCASWSRTTSTSCASPSAAATAGLEEAMRYSLLAGGKRIRPVLTLATARAAGIEPESVLPDRRRDRADPHLLADPRRPAGDGRRRPAPRAADVARRTTARTSRSSPATASSPRRCGSFAERQSGRAGARCVAALREIGTATGVEGMVGGQYVDVTEPDLDADGLRGLHELKTGKLIARERRASHCSLPA